METFSTLLAICAGNSPVPVNSPHKGQWRGALVFSLICVWINDSVNNRKAGDLSCRHGHFDVNVMIYTHIMRCLNNCFPRRAFLLFSLECEKGFFLWVQLTESQYVFNGLAAELWKTITKSNNVGYQQCVSWMKYINTFASGGLRYTSLIIEAPNTLYRLLWFPVIFRYSRYFISTQTLPVVFPMPEIIDGPILNDNSNINAA